MLISAKKVERIDRVLLCTTVAQLILIAVGVIYPMDVLNHVMYVVNYAIGFLCILSLAVRNVATNFLPIAFFGCYMLFLMAQKPFKPDHDVFLTFAWVQLDVRQYVTFSSILFCGLAGTYYAYMSSLNQKKTEKVRLLQNVNLKSLTFILGILVCLTFPFALYMQGKIVLEKSGLDYTSGYLVNVDVPGVIKIGNYLYGAVVLMYLALKPGKKRMFLTLGTYLLVEGGMQLLQGRRALFAATVLFTAWYLLKYFNVVNVKKKIFLLIAALAVVMVCLFVVVEQGRDGTSQGISFDAIRRFLISNGGSDSVIANTIVRKDDFPEKGILYLLDPIVNNFVGNILQGKPSLPQGLDYVMQHNSFSHWLSYLTESSLYLSGHGMGSAYLAEVYLAFGMIGVVLASVIMGWAIHKINAIELGTGLGPVFALFFAGKIFTMPRGSMFGWVGEIIYLIFAIVIVASVYILWCLKNKVGKGETNNVEARNISEESVRTVTFGVIAYNEHQYLPELLQNLLEQTYPRNLTEVILVDGQSSDDTKQIMEAFRDKYMAEYLSIQVLDNPKRVQPAGWNIVIENSKADVILRIDAHAKLPADFIERNMACINSGEYVCGGPRENIIDDDTSWKRMLLDAEQSLFGSGFAAYRRETEERRYVKSVFHGAYRREVFAHAGTFNENLVRTEDNEIHYRLRKNGYNICYEPTIHSYYQTRNTLPRMLKQKYQNGLWIGKTLYVCPGCISVFHFIPFVFVSGLTICALLAFLGVRWLLALLVGTYLTFVSINMLICLFKTKNKADIVLPIVYFLMHIAYGAGTVVGLLTKDKV